MALLFKKIPLSSSLCCRRYLNQVTTHKYSHKTYSNMANKHEIHLKEELLKKLEIFQWLGNETPCFSLNGNKVMYTFNLRIFFNI